MKVLMLNGSARPGGNTNAALTEIGKELEKEGISYEIFQIGAGPVRDCIGCGQWTECFTAAADPLRLSPGHRLPWQEGAAPALPLM